MGLIYDLMKQLLFQMWISLQLVVIQILSLLLVRHFIKTEHENVAVGLVYNYHAFKGYSYLLVSNGFGLIATVLFNDFKI
jgi:hypothetical protein